MPRSQRDKADSDCDNQCLSPVSGYQTALLKPRQGAMISGCFAQCAFFARSEHEVRSANAGFQKWTDRCLSDPFQKLPETYRA